MDVDLGGETKALGGHVRGGANARGSKSERTRLRLGGCDKVRDRIEAACFGSNQQIGVTCR